MGMSKENLSQPHQMFNKLLDRCCNRVLSGTAAQGFGCRVFPAQNDRSQGQIPAWPGSLRAGRGSRMWIWDPSSASHGTHSELPASHSKGCLPVCFVSQQILQDIDPEEFKQQQLRFPQEKENVAGPAVQGFNLGAGNGLEPHRMWDGIFPAARAP